MLNKNANNARKSLALALLLTASAVTLTGCGATGADSDLVAYFVNQGMASDAISSIEIDGNKATIDPAQNELIKDRPVIFGGPTATAKATFAGINPVAGYRVDVTVNFVAAAPVKLNALITE